MNKNINKLSDVIIVIMMGFLLYLASFIISSGFEQYTALIFFVGGVVWASVCNGYYKNKDV